MCRLRPGFPELTYSTDTSRGASVRACRLASPGASARGSRRLAREQGQVAFARPGAAPLRVRPPDVPLPPHGRELAIDEGVQVTLGRLKVVHSALLDIERRERGAWL